MRTIEVRLEVRGVLMGDFIIFIPLNGELCFDCRMKVFKKQAILNRRDRIWMLLIRMEMLKLK